MIIQHFKARLENVSSFSARMITVGRGRNRRDIPQHVPVAWNNGEIEYYEVIGVVQGRASPQVPDLIRRYNLRGMVRGQDQLRDSWHFEGPLRLGTGTTAGRWVISGHVRVLRLTDRIASQLGKAWHPIRRLELSVGPEGGGAKLHIPWTSGGFVGHVPRPTWFDGPDVLEREQVAVKENGKETMRDAYRAVTVTWGYDTRYHAELNHLEAIPRPGVLTVLPYR